MTRIARWFAAVPAASSCLTGCCAFRGRMRCELGRGRGEEGRAAVRGGGWVGVLVGGRSRGRAGGIPRRLVSAEKAFEARRQGCAAGCPAGDARSARGGAVRTTSLPPVRPRPARVDSVSRQGGSSVARRHAWVGRRAHWRRRAGAAATACRRCRSVPGPASRDSAASPAGVGTRWPPRRPAARGTASTPRAVAPPCPPGAAAARAPRPGAGR